MHRHFTATDSTNEEALRWGREGASHGAYVTADAQTAGRGRRGRAWSSPPGKGLYLSLIVRPGAPHRDSATLLPGLNFAACLAATRAVREVTGLTCHTKWPNDVLANGRKIAGLLSEAMWREGRLDFSVVGIGINVNQAQDDLPPRPLYPASSLFIESGQEWPINEVRDRWLHHFGNYYKRLEKGDWEQVRDEFWRRCAQRNREVIVQSEGETLTGTALALGSDGALLLETSSGMRRILAGDVVITHNAKAE